MISDMKPPETSYCNFGSLKMRHILGARYPPLLFKTNKNKETNRWKLPILKGKKNNTKQSPYFKQRRCGNKNIQNHPTKNYIINIHIAISTCIIPAAAVIHHIWKMLYPWAYIWPSPFCISHPCVYVYYSQSCALLRSRPNSGVVIGPICLTCGCRCVTMWWNWQFSLTAPIHGEPHDVWQYCRMSGLNHTCSGSLVSK